MNMRTFRPNKTCLLYTSTANTYAQINLMPVGETVSSPAKTVVNLVFHDSSHRLQRRENPHLILLNFTGTFSLKRLVRIQASACILKDILFLSVLGNFTEYDYILNLQLLYLIFHQKERVFLGGGVSARSGRKGGTLTVSRDGLQKVPVLLEIQTAAPSGSKR